MATQKPSGVVDDQIWSNSKCRVGLKVQDKADSNDMLKRPEAAMLKATGRFYLQVGYNEEEIRVFIPKEIRKILMTLDCEACDYKDALKKYYYDQVNS